MLRWRPVRLGLSVVLRDVGPHFPGPLEGAISKARRTGASRAIARPAVRELVRLSVVSSAGHALRRGMLSFCLTCWAVQCAPFCSIHP